MGTIKKDYLDYLIVFQLCISMLMYIYFKIPYKSIIVYFSFLIFFSYWLIGIIFNPKYKERISGY